VTEVILILNKKGDILDFSPRNVDVRNILNDIKQEEIYDDGELIRVRGIVNK